MRKKIEPMKQMSTATFFKQARKQEGNAHLQFAKNRKTGWQGFVEDPVLKGGIKVNFLTLCIVVEKLINLFCQ